MSKAGKVIKGAESKANKMRSDYKHSKAYTNASWLQSATINDIAKKYGFDFSQAFANKQAETAAQGQRNQYNAQQRSNDSTHAVTMKQIQDAYDSSAGALDTNYFKQFVGAQQSMANRGLNSGIAAAQNLQLGMNKQKEVADLWKQKNTNSVNEDLRFANQNQTISDALAQVEKEKSVNSQKLYQDLLAQGYNILSGDRNSAANWANTQWGMTQDSIGNMMDLTKMNVNDIYDQEDRAAQAAQLAATRAAARGGSGRGRSGGGSGGSNYSAPKSVQPYLNSYNQAKGPQGPGSPNTTLDKYYQNPVIRAVQNSPSKLVHQVFSNPLPPAQNPNLSAWDQMKLLGL